MTDVCRPASSPRPDRRQRWRIPSVIALALSLAVTSTSHAQPMPNADADRLFTEGKAAMEQSDWPTACAKFQASVDAEDALGTRLNLGLCFERWGKVKTALDVYEAALAAAERVGAPAFADKARERSTALRPRLSYLRVFIDDPTIKVVASRPGYPDQVMTSNVSIPVDPSDPKDPSTAWTITATGEGRKSLTLAAIYLRESDTKNETIGKLLPVDDVGGGDPPPALPPTQGTRSRTLPLALVIGGSALVVGGTGWAAYEKSSCDGCDVDAAKSRQRWGATPMVIVGAGLAGYGAYLLLSGGDEKPAGQTAWAPVVSADGAGLAVFGQF